MADTAEVILVHGLWYRAWSMRVLKDRLERCGFPVRCFSYPTRTGALTANVAALAAFAGSSPAGKLHFVAHSLGGILTLNMLSAREDLPPGRVVLLGSPLGGSEVARRVHRWPGGPFMLGHAAEPLHEGRRQLPEDRDVGMIAGVRTLGLGRITGGVESPHDGTVSVSETEADGLADRIELSVTHTGMLVSQEVATQAASFLRTGRFKRPGLR